MADAFQKEAENVYGNKSPPLEASCRAATGPKSTSTRGGAARGCVRVNPHVAMADQSNKMGKNYPGEACWENVKKISVIMSDHPIYYLSGVQVEAAKVC